MEKGVDKGVEVCNMDKLSQDSGPLKKSLKKL
jgi:hypothetical protein